MSPDVEYPAHVLFDSNGDETGCHVGVGMKSSMAPGSQVDNFEALGTELVTAHFEVVARHDMNPMVASALSDEVIDLHSLNLHELHSV